MAYRKRYEDSYLDEDEKDEDDLGKTDVERIIALVRKPSRTEKEDEKVRLLTERLFNGAKLPTPLGPEAAAELGLVAHAYADIGARDKAASLWEKLGDLAAATGDKELYYRAMDEIANLE